MGSLRRPMTLGDQVSGKSWPLIVDLTNDGSWFDQLRVYTEMENE